MKLFTKIVNGFKPLTILPKRSIVYVRLDSKYTADTTSNKLQCILTVIKPIERNSKDW